MINRARELRRFAAGALRPALTLLALLALAGGASPAAAAYDHLQWCVDPLQMPYSQRDVYPPGFDIEIAAMISKVLNKEQEIYWADTGTRGGMGRAMRQSISAGKCNAFMGIVSAEQMAGELEEKGLVLTEPYMAVGLVLIVHKNSPPIRSIDDLSDKITGIQNATYGHRVVIVNKFDYRRFRFPNQLLEAVEREEVDAGLLFGPMAGWTVHNEYEGRVAISDQFKPGHDYQWDIGIAVRKEDTDLKADLDRAIAQLRADNAIAPILAKYGVPYIEPSVP